MCAMQAGKQFDSLHVLAGCHFLTGPFYTDYSHSYVAGTDFPFEPTVKCIYHLNG